MRSRCRCKQGRTSLNEKIAQARPVVVILVNNQRDLRTSRNIAYPAQLAFANALGFFVQGGIEVGAVKGIADRYNVRFTLCVGRGKTRDTLRVNKGYFDLCKC